MHNHSRILVHKQLKTSSDIESGNKKLQLQEQQVSDKAAAMSKDLEIKLKQIEQKDRAIMNDRYIAEINKN
jgi:hypothetical protein